MAAASAPAAAVSLEWCRVCVPLLGSSVEEMVGDMERAFRHGADLVEFRLDHLSHFDPPSHLPLLLRAPSRSCPAILTFRPTWAGGRYDGDESSRLDALRLAFDLGADYIDLELEIAASFISGLDRSRNDYCKVIVSDHNFHDTPPCEELAALVARMQSSGADIVKVVTTAQKITDVATLFRILSASQVPTIALSMGQYGLISRLLAPKFGGFLTFASLESGKESAPGQPTVSEIRQIYDVGRAGRDTEIFGIIGRFVGYSKSPIIHNKFLQQIGYDGIYVPFLADDIHEFFNVYHVSMFSGFSISIPYKEAAMAYCDEVEPLAKAIGAVNTIARRKSDGKFVGYNTDCEAAITAIEEGLNGGPSPLSGKYFVLIGAGGAARALAYGAKQRGARIFIANRNLERASELAAAVDGEVMSMEDLNVFRPTTGMVLANTTPIGMHPNSAETPIAKEALSAYSLVFDAVYTPKVTRLLREAQEAGVAVVSGVEMFIRQAIEQFSHFVGQPVPKQTLREVVIAAM